MPICTLFLNALACPLDLILYLNMKFKYLHKLILLLLIVSATLASPNLETSQYLLDYPEVGTGKPSLPLSIVCSSKMTSRMMNSLTHVFYF